MRSLSETIARERAELVSIRRDIHAHPEPGFEEHRTQELILRELRASGLAPRSAARTGVIVDIGEGPGPGLALRADIDCLRMTEENHALPYRSTRDGLAHMCGHDGHTAVLLGAARTLAPRAAELPGRVRLLFQPAEEGPGGAPELIACGALEGIDEVYGMHNWPAAPLGSLRTITGPCMATVATFELVVNGKGGHASQPQDSIDPVVIAAHIVTALQSIIARNVHYEERAVVSVTTIHGGEVFNVIPDKVTLQGTIRALSEEVYELIAERIEGLATSIAEAFGGRAAVAIERMYPVVVNSPSETEEVRAVGAALFGEDQVSSEQLPMLGAEDFSYYLLERPGCFFFLGGGEEGRSNSMCHATDFDFNDALISPGVGFWVRLVERRLGVRLFG
jgi:amidohydrolase